MNKETFLKMLHKSPEWDNMVRRGNMGVVVTYGSVPFYVFRDDATHYLRAIPQSSTELAKVMAFNALMRSCRKELAQELDKWNSIRLTRDDNEGDR